MLYDNVKKLPVLNLNARERKKLLALVRLRLFEPFIWHIGLFPQLQLLSKLLMPHCKWGMCQNIQTFSLFALNNLSKSNLNSSAQLLLHVVPSNSAQNLLMTTDGNYAQSNILRPVYLNCLLQILVLVRLLWQHL